MARIARKARASSPPEASPAAADRPIGQPLSAAASRRDDSRERVFRESLRKRIGAQRYDLWFTDGAAIEVHARDSGAVDVRVVVDGAFALEWLQRSFHADMAATAREAFGACVDIAWRHRPTGTSQPAAVDGPGDDPSPTAPADAPVSGGVVSGGVEPGGVEPGGVEPGGVEPGGREPTVLDDPPPRSDRGLTVPPRAMERASHGADRRRNVASDAPTVRTRPRLEEFVSGAPNRMACTAVEMALQRPGHVSPLVIVGPGGCGKTHLLEGFCQRIRERRPTAGVLLQSAEQFTTSFLQSLHGGGAAAFRRGCRSAEVFVIDDVQFFAGRNARATVTELLHTVDALLRRGRQVVIAADRDVETITELGPDLLARLRGGMTARILPADETLRRGIVAAMAARRGVDLPDDVVAFLAARLVRHPRELAGAVNRLEATSLMLGVPVTLDLATEALADLLRACGRGIRLVDIDRAVCAGLGLAPGTLQARTRGRAANHPRMLAMFLARKHTAAPLAEIGAFFGRRSHSTVLAAQKTVAGWLAAERPVILAETTWRIADAIRCLEERLAAG